MPINMKDVIADAFLKLAREKRIDKITVKELVAHCGISRQTFYYHFKDMIEVIEWVIRKEGKRILQQSLQADNEEQAICYLVSGIAENSDLLWKLLNSQKRESVEQIVLDCVSTYLRETLLKQDPQIALRATDAQMLLRFGTYGITGLLLEDCSKHHMDTEKLSAQIVQLYRLLRL